jgi:hypothetical protein
MRIAWEEPFGPVLPVIRVKTVEEAIDHCNANNLALQVRTPAPEYFFFFFFFFGLGVAVFPVYPPSYIVFPSVALLALT